MNPVTIVLSHNPLLVSVDVRPYLQKYHFIPPCCGETTWLGVIIFMIQPSLTLSWFRKPCHVSCPPASYL